MVKKPFKKGDLIKFNFLYSNEEEKIGIVNKVIKDNNFVYMIQVITSGKQKVTVPYIIMDYEILN